MGRVIMSGIAPLLTVPKTTHIYGAIWDGSSSTAWTRTDEAVGFADPNPAVANGTGSSPFDNIMPWAGMQRVTDPEAGELVSIPKFWYKWTKDGNSLKLQIANGAVDGFYVSPAHADRGDGKGERDMVYVGRYHCGSGWKSVSGVVPYNTISRARARIAISNLSSLIWQYDFAMYWTIMMLYLVEFANWNSQNVIGYGCSQNGEKFSCGATDNMLYHTGTNVATRTTYGCVQYRYIEGLWDNVCDWCDGIYFYNAKMYAIKNPSNFSDTSGGTYLGTLTTTPSTDKYTIGFGMPSELGFEYALYPNTFGGSNSTYVCDRYGYLSGAQLLYTGGYYYQTQSWGAFYFAALYSTENYADHVGCRLMKLP